MQRGCTTFFYVLCVHGQLRIFGGCSREHPYRVNALIIRDVGMLPGASAEYTSLSHNPVYGEAALILIYPLFHVKRNVIKII